MFSFTVCFHSCFHFRFAAANIIRRDSKGGYDNVPEVVPVSLAKTTIDRFRQIKIQLGSAAERIQTK